MNEVSINKQAKLSEHFSLGELTKTKHVTADKNIPSHEVIENLKRLCGGYPLRGQGADDTLCEYPAGYRRRYEAGL